MERCSRPGRRSSRSGRAELAMAAVATTRMRIRRPAAEKVAAMLARDVTEHGAFTASAGRTRCMPAPRTRVSIARAKARRAGSAIWATRAMMVETEPCAQWARASPSSQERSGGGRPGQPGDRNGTRPGSWRAGDRSASASSRSTRTRHSVSRCKPRRTPPTATPWIPLGCRITVGRAVRSFVLRNPSPIMPQV